MPVEPIPPTALGWSQLMAPLPAWVSATGMPVAVANARNCSDPSAYTTPPPATTSGRFADLMTSTARASAAASGAGRPMCQTRGRNSATGQSNASACTSCGRQIVTAPVSAGSVSTRIAPSNDGMSCSGRLIRSKKRDTGRKTSLTDTSRVPGSSNCWSTGSG